MTDGAQEAGQPAEDEAASIGKRLDPESERLKEDARAARDYQVRFGDWARVHGGVAGRDQYNVYVATTERHGLLTRAIPDAELRRIKRVYVRPPEHHLRAVEVLRHRGVVVLRGERQVGKRTAALRLLHAAGCARVIELDNDLDLERLCAFEFEPGAGYLVDKLPREVAAGLSPFRLGVLQGKLSGEAKLVMTVDAPYRLPDEAFRGYGVDWQAPRDRRQLFQRHLRPAGRANDLLARREIAALLAEAAAPADVELLATLLSNGTPPDRAPSSFRDERANRRVVDWFQRHEDRQARALFVALAVLDRSPYRVVLDQAARLHRRWAPEELEPPPSPRPPRLRLADAYARLVHAWDGGHRSLDPTEQAELDDPAMAKWILEFAWRELDDLREPLLGWLAELAVSREEQPTIHGRAAAAAGNLCLRDFQHVRRTVLEPWVDRQEKSATGAALAREAVTTALGVAAVQHSGPRLAAFLVRTLRAWSARDAPRSRRQAAAAAYGGLLGVRYPRGSMRRLRQLAAAGDFSVFWITRQSMVNLFHGQPVAVELRLDPIPDYRRIVLNELLWWTRTPDPYRGLVLFLTLARQARDRAGPAMLLLAAEAPYQRMVGVLLDRALGDRRVRTEALRLLRDWLRAADRAPRLVTPVVGLVEDMAASAAHGRQRLLAYLPLWAEAAGGSATARRCLDALGGA